MSPEARFFSLPLCASQGSKVPHLRGLRLPFDASHFFLRRLASGRSVTVRRQDGDPVIIRGSNGEALGHNGQFPHPRVVGLVAYFRFFFIGAAPRFLGGRGLGTIGALNGGPPGDAPGIGIATCA